MARKRKWLSDLNLKEGAFTSYAKRHDMDVQEAADAVISGKIKASSTTRRRARLAKLFERMAEKRKRD